VIGGEEWLLLLALLGLVVLGVGMALLVARTSRRR
jgi:hypothetical protein